MATTTSVPRVGEQTTPQARVLSNRRLRRTEALLGLLFAAPAVIVAFIFQIFPVAYGFFISLQGQVGVLPAGFIGLENFLKAVGSLAYMVTLAIALVLALGAYLLYRRARQKQADGKGNFIPYLIPGFIGGSGTLVFFVLAFRLRLDYTWPAILIILVAVGLYYVINAQRSSESGVESNYTLYSWGIGLFTVSAVTLAIFTFTEIQNALNPVLINLPRFVKGEYIYPLNTQIWAFLGVVAAFGAVLTINVVREKLDPDDKPGPRFRLALLRVGLILVSLLFVIYIMTAQGALQGTIAKLRAIPAADLRTQVRDLRGELGPELTLAFSPTRQAELAQRLNAWSEVYTMLLGLSFVCLAFLIWDGARKRETTIGMLGMVFMAICLMAGGYLFISELPQAAAAGDTKFYDSLVRTVTYAILTVPIQLVIGLALAYLLFHEVRRFKGVFRLIFFTPYIAPTVATAAVFAMIFSSSPISPANQIMQAFGMRPQEWLQTPKGIFEILVEQISPGTKLPLYLVGPSLPLLSAILYAIWVFSGYNAVIFMAGLGNVPKEVYEAAQVDGAGRWTTFRKIVFPLISPTTFFLTLLALVGTFRAFTHIYVLRNDDRGGIDTAMIYIYEIIRVPNPARTQTYAASLSFLLFGIILILTIIQNRLTKDRIFYG